MCTERLRMRVERPLARALQRLSVGPLFTLTSETYKVSASLFSLFSAFATADLNALSIAAHDFCGLKANALIAKDTDLPRIILAAAVSYTHLRAHETLR